MIIYFVTVAFILVIYWFFFASKAVQPKITKTTSTTTTAPQNIGLPQPDTAWLSVTGYTQSFNTCKNLCQQYQQSNCIVSTAKQYCDTEIAVDLNKDGTIQHNAGRTPFGGVTCENSMGCYDIILECTCGKNPLNTNTCISFYIEQVKDTTGCTMPSA